jgi:hypothetical protein
MEGNPMTQTTKPKPTAHTSTTGTQSALDDFDRTLASVQDSMDALRLIEIQLRREVAARGAADPVDAAAGFEAAAAAIRNAYAQGFDAGVAAARAAEAERQPAAAQKAAAVGDRGLRAPRRNRALILLPARTDQETRRWLGIGSQYAMARNLDLVGTVASNVAGMRDAINLVTGGDVDMLIAARPEHLWPLVQIVSLAGPADVPNSQRRTRRLYPPEPDLASRRPGWILPDAGGDARARRPSLLPVQADAPVIPIRPDRRTGRYSGGRL